MTDNLYTEHATMTTLYEREVEKNRKLRIIAWVLGMIILIAIVFNVLLFGLALRADRFFYSECVSYPKLPLPVPTPTKWNQENMSIKTHNVPIIVLVGDY